MNFVRNIMTTERKRRSTIEVLNTKQYRIRSANGRILSTSDVYYSQSNARRAAKRRATKAGFLYKDLSR